MASPAMLPLWLIHVLLITRSNVANSQHAECLHTNGNSLPVFQGYPAPPPMRIQHQHQAIIPSYKFRCCGNITEWGVDLNPVDDATRFTFDFQVWRPSPTVDEDECYSLVNNYIIRSTSLPTDATINHVAIVTPLPQDQLLFQPGDVLGFYVESHSAKSDYDNGVVVLNDSSHINELVWFASINIAAQTGSCPYPVGTTGVLDSSTRAAPVISISVTSYSCPESSNTIVSTVSAAELLPPQQTPINTPTVQLRPPQQTPTISNPATPATRNTDSLVAGVVVTVIIVCIMLVGVVVITSVLIIVVIRRRKNSTNLSHGLNDDREVQYVYDYSAVNTAQSIQMEQNEAYAIHSNKESQPIQVKMNEAYSISQSIQVKTNEAYATHSNKAIKVEPNAAYATHSNMTS